MVSLKASIRGLLFGAHKGYYKVWGFRLEGLGFGIGGPVKVRTFEIEDSTTVEVQCVI